MQFPESLKSLGLIVTGFTAGIAAFQSILSIAFVVSNDVEGTISLALENIPWDLALDSILIATGNQLEERNGLFYVSKKY